MGDAWSYAYDALKYAAAAAPTVAKDTATTQAVASGNAAGAAAINPDAAKYITNTAVSNVNTASKAVSQAAGYISSNPDAQNQIASGLAASADQAATKAAGQTATANASAANNAVTAGLLKAQDDALTKQASAAAARTSNILTGVGGVARGAEKTSAIVLGGSDADGAKKMGQSNGVGDALLGGIKAIAGSAPARRKAA